MDSKPSDAVSVLSNATGAMPRRTVTVLLIFAATAWIFHAIRLYSAFQWGRNTGVDVTTGIDTSVYREIANALEQGKRLDPTYQERLLVPMMLVALRHLGWGDGGYPWLITLLVPFVVFALGWLVWEITHRVWAVVLCGILFLVYPNAYQYGPVIETDLLHAYLGSLAVVSLVAARRMRSRFFLHATGLSWFLTHLTRPALWGMGLLLPYFLWPRVRERASRFAALFACVGALVVPVSLTLNNGLRFGIWTPSFHTAEILWSWTCSRVEAAVRAETNGTKLTPVVEAEVAKARRDPRWKILHGEYRDRAEFAIAYRSIMSECRAYLRRHVLVLIRTTIGEWVHQLSAPLRYKYIYPTTQSPPKDHRILRWMLKLAWWFGWCGWVWLWHTRSRDVAGISTAVALLNILPAGLSCWLTARIRLPLDLLGLPMLTCGLGWLTAWQGLAALVAAGYVPRRLGAPAWWFNWIAAVSAIMIAFAPWRTTATRVKRRIVP